jgi:predicted Zn-dependent peptidase
MYEDNPIMQVDSLMEEDLYRGAALGRQVAGSLDTVSRLSRADLLDFRDKYYVPKRTVVAVAGNFDEAEAIRLVTESFGGRAKQKGGPDCRRFEVSQANYRCPRVRIQVKDLEQYSLSLGFPSYGYGHPRLAALTLLSVILGGTMSSRLFLEVREKRGLAYFIRSSSSVYQDVGNLSVQAGLARERLTEALQVILAELKKMKVKPVTAAELKRAKQFVKGKTVLHLEDSTDLAEWFARQELLEGRIETPEAKLERIFAVTPADIQSVAKELFRSSRLSIAVIGPEYDPVKLAKLAKEL